MRCIHFINSNKHLFVSLKKNIVGKIDCHSAWTDAGTKKSISLGRCSMYATHTTNLWRNKSSYYLQLVHDITFFHSKQQALKQKELDRTSIGAHPESWPRLCHDLHVGSSRNHWPFLESNFEEQLHLNQKQLLLLLQDTLQIHLICLLSKFNMHTSKHQLNSTLKVFKE